MSQWSLPRVLGKVCLPPTSVRIIVIITMIFALIAIFFAVVVLLWHGGQIAPVAAALGAVAATVMLSEGVVRRLTRWQHPDIA